VLLHQGAILHFTDNYSKNYHAFIVKKLLCVYMDKRIGPLVKISLDTGKMNLAYGIKFFSNIKHSNVAWPWVPG
jgi:hypothetical protein